MKSWRPAALVLMSVCAPGWLKQRQGSYATGVTMLATVTMATAVLVFLFPMQSTPAARRHNSSGAPLLRTASTGRIGAKKERRDAAGD